jgi:hypothetical protein
MSELELSLFRQRSQGALKSKARRGALFLGVAAGCVTTGGDRIEQLINALRGMASAACRGQPAGRWLLSDGALTAGKPSL